MPQDTAVVALSGGMDSCVCTAIAVREHVLAVLHLNYGQRTERRELRAFREIADFYEVPSELRLEVSVEHLRKIGGSSLVDRRIPLRTSGVEDGQVPSSYVPFRNAHILAIAVSWAEVLGARYVYIGANERDSSGYPDCREEFYRAFQQVVDLGTKPGAGIRIATPLIRLTKAEIIRQGNELGAPFELTWSCYAEEERACGVCDSCRLRLKGFAEAGLRDPIAYAR